MLSSGSLHQMGAMGVTVAVLAEGGPWWQQHIQVANQAIALTLHTVISRLVDGCP